jgi:hypothetical protein
MTFFEYFRGEILAILSFKLLLISGSVVVKALCYKPEGSGFDTI